MSMSAFEASPFECKPDEVDFVTPGMHVEHDITEAARRITDALLEVPVLYRSDVLRDLSALAVKAEEIAKRHG